MLHNLKVNQTSFILYFDKVEILTPPSSILLELTQNIFHDLLIAKIFFFLVLLFHNFQCNSWEQKNLWYFIHLYNTIRGFILICDFYFATAFLKNFKCCVNKTQYLGLRDFQGSYTSTRFFIFRGHIGKVYLSINAKHKI